MLFLGIHEGGKKDIFYVRNFSIDIKTVDLYVERKE